MQLGGMIYNTMKYIAMENGHAGPVFAPSTGLCILWEWTWGRSKELRYRSNSLGILAICLKFDGVMHSTMK